MKSVERWWYSLGWFEECVIVIEDIEIIMREISGFIFLVVCFIV